MIKKEKEEKTPHCQAIVTGAPSKEAALEALYRIDSMTQLQAEVVP